MNKLWVPFPCGTNGQIDESLSLNGRQDGNIWFIMKNENFVLTRVPQY
jgi:hypothetical protein